jgi:hypothetical protein
MIARRERGVFTLARVNPDLPRRDRLALRRSQIVKGPGGPFQFGIESADA